ncbi:HalOD1 output domain-containing protein [Halorarum salinum]|uniref:Halobacterial output domain-containing protein n=1 Tax=Halorarum salinum TaxID=2743089 RepID=A0A7D5LCH4_9EURY|nr:HalOD1 output domain-containing protein [Halobaculum salinum]QLG63294.1 hypothetical protein HUG12_16770 [Halobaculum salinum]
MTSGPLTLYRGCTPVVDARYHVESDRSPVEALIGALAEAEGVDATDLPSLYDVVDTDALNQLFSRRDGPGNADTVLSFQFDTWNVFVRADGRIRVCDATEPTDPEPVFDTVTA